MSINRNEYFPYDDDSDGSADIEINDEDDHKNPADKDSPGFSVDEASVVVNDSGGVTHKDETIEISDESSTSDDVEPKTCISKSKRRMSPNGLKRDPRQVLEEEEVVEDGKRKNPKQSPSTTENNCESCEVTEILSTKYPFYCLMKVLVDNEGIALPVHVNEVNYNEADETMLLRHRTLGNMLGRDFQLLVYEIINDWETKALKLSSEKMEFLKSKANDQSYLDTNLKKGLPLCKGDKLGHGIFCLKKEKLLGAATFLGGISVLEKRLDEKIESKLYTLKEEEMKLLETKEWEEFKDKEVLDDLMLIQKGNSDLVLVGNWSSVTTFWNKMASFLEENSIVSTKVREKREVVIKFLNLHCLDTIRNQSSQVEVCLGRGFVELSGRKNHVKLVSDFVKDIIGKLEINSFEESKPGLQASMFKQNEGVIKSLKEVELLNHCAVWVTDRNKPISPTQGNKLKNMASMLINLFKNVFKSDDISNDSTQEANRGVSSVATTRVSVQMGNITSSQDSVVLVNTLVSRKSNNLSDCGVVSQSFYSAGGVELQKEFCKQNLPQTFGVDLASTKATGNLHCKEIFHIYVSKYRNRISLKLMKDTIKMCVDKALSKGYSSIAFPTIGCGRLGYNVRDICQCFREVEKEVSRASNDPIKIIIYAITRQLYDQFTNLLSSANQTLSRPLTPDTVNEEWEDPSSNVDDNDDVCQEKIVTFNVCTLTQEKGKFAEIQKSITEKLKNLCGEKKIVHDLLADYENLSPECFKNILAVGIEKVSAEIDSNAKTMYLRGPSDEIRKMSKKIKEILNEEMKLLNDPFYLKKVKGVKAYLEHYLNSENIPFPKYWKNHGKATKDAQILKTPLGPNDNLFKEICKLIEKTWEANKAGGQGKDARNLSHFNIEVKNIFIIENPELFYDYRSSQKSLCYKALNNTKNKSQIADITTNGEKDVATKKVSKQLDEILIPEINEYYLFHGTKSDKIDKIGQQGIDSRVCAENAMFGRGAYFAESPTKADQYADYKVNRSGQGAILSMFMSRVLLGYSHLCNKPTLFTRPPCSESSCAGLVECNDHSHKLSDSVVGLCRNDGSRLLFREFVVYKSDQSYPEFLIEYVRK